MWDKLISYDNLYLAYKKARKVKPNSNMVLSFDFNLERNLLKLQSELVNNTYKVSKYNVFIIYEPKKRVIKALPFKDRIIQHALINIIEPIFEKAFIYNSFACRKNKGIYEALIRIRRQIQSNKPKKYFLKADVKKYFYSVDQSVLKKIISKRIKDKKVISLVYRLIDSDHSYLGLKKGIPIGNLSSQLFANIYLNELDQFVKHKLKIKHYYRYVDDFLILSNSKKQLNKVIYEIRCFLKNDLKLKLPSKKTNICLTKDGVDFVGYKIYLDYIKLRKSNIKRFIGRTKNNIYLYNKCKLDENNLESSICSFLGYAKHANAYLISKKLFNIYFDKWTYLLNKIYASDIK